MSSKPFFLPTTFSQTERSASAIPSDWWTTIALLAADSLSLCLAMGLAALGRRIVYGNYNGNAILELLPCTLIAVLAFWAQGLYPGILRHPIEEMRRVYISVTLVVLSVAATTFVWRTGAFYLALFIAWLSMPLLVLLNRYLVREQFGTQPWWGVSAVVLGSGPTANRVIHSLEDGRKGVKVAAVVPSEYIVAYSNDEANVAADEWLSLKMLAPFAQYVIVAIPEHLAVELRTAIHHCCRGFSQVILIPDMPRLCSLGLSAMDLGGAFGVAMPQRLFNRGAAFLKRVMDIVLGGAALVLAAPLFLFTALVIKVNSRGPLLYRQERIGKNGEKFAALKFRTMIQNADAVLKEYLASNPEAEREWRRDHKLKNDPRIIPAGKWLRRLSLDELPQLWNVLVGQMSLVGPRPIVEAEIERYGDGYEYYCRVRPGITGLWQVSGRNNTTYSERVSFDEYYVKNWSGWLDAYLLICTVKAVVTADGAY